MATKHVLKISSIYEFFDNDNKIIKKGENALESNHVLKMQFDADLMKIRGEIHASMKDRTYNVEIQLISSGDIASATCNCPRGIKCHHTSALALFGHYNISVTDKECSWNVPKTVVNALIKTAEEMYPTKPFKAIVETISEEQKNVLKTKLSSLGNTVGFTWLLQDEEPSTGVTVPVIEDIISTEVFREKTSKEQLSYFKEQCALNDNIIKEIAETTKGQSCNETWYLIRKFRLTASSFGTVLAACQRKRYPPSLFKSLLGAYTLDGVKFIQWGRTHEKYGIEYLKTNLQLDVQETGILRVCEPNSGFLGASPDGLVRKDAIVEVKCPYSFRNDVLAPKLKNNSNYVISYNNNDEICINLNHNYYHQIQGNMHILKREKCYLCIWTLKDVVLVEIDHSWNGNLEILENFYVNEYLPKILDENK